MIKKKKTIMLSKKKYFILLENKKEVKIPNCNIDSIFFFRIVPHFLKIIFNNICIPDLFLEMKTFNQIIYRALLSTDFSHKNLS